MKIDVLPKLPIGWSRLAGSLSGCRPFGRALRALGLCLLVLAGCAPQPMLDADRATPPLVLVPTTDAGIVDQRARFREIFCALSEDHGSALPDHRPCDQALHRLTGEAPASGAAVNLGRARIGLRVVIVPGLAAECFGVLALPMRFAAAHVEKLGYEVSWMDVDGLSSSAHNAAEIRAAVLAMEEAPERPIVLLGYSKGAADLLEASADPALAARVAAVVSLGGAINGSPLADRASDAWFSLLAHLPGTTCEEGDRGALDSMRRSTRMDWLAAHPSPSLRTYALVSYASRDQVSAVLRSSYDDLSLIDPRNDSQLLFYDQIAPGSTLLGYLNGDHWAVAMPIGRDSPLIQPLIDRNAFPREILLEAILKQVEEDLMAAEGAAIAGAGES
jgi:hypothetical protein